MLKTVIYKYPKGYTGIYEDGFKPGDLITAYQSGYHEFVEYKERKDSVPLVIHKKRYDKKGKPKKSAFKQCDAAYCRFAKDGIEKSIKEKLEEIEWLKKIPV